MIINISKINYNGGGSSGGGTSGDKNPFDELLGYSTKEKNELKKIEKEFREDNIALTNQYFEDGKVIIGEYSSSTAIYNPIVYAPPVDTGSVNSLQYMYLNCNKMIYVPYFYVGENVTNMSNMFQGCTSLSTLDLSGWDTSNVTNIEYIFSNCSSLSTLDLSGWYTSNVTNMNNMFYGCSSLSTLDLSGWDTSNVTNMNNMFSNCSSLTSLNLSGWDIPNVKRLYYTFNSCTSLPSLDINGWDTSSVTGMTYVFSNCSSLSTLDLSKWDTSNVTDMSNIFYGCSSLSTLDLSGWDFNKVTNMNNMFLSCSNLITLNLTNAKMSDMTIKHQLFSTTLANMENLYLDGVTLPNVNHNSTNVGMWNKITIDSLVGILNALPVTTSGYTFKMGSTQLRKLTDDQKAIATDKGWILS